VRFGRDIVYLTRKILLNRNIYFSNDQMNSEGRKIFEELSRMIIDEHPYLKNQVKKTRKRGDLLSFIKLSEIILGEKEVQEILYATTHPPYVFKDTDPPY
jgi:predicted ABC-class ATPase